MHENAFDNVVYHQSNHNFVKYQVHRTIPDTTSCLLAQITLREADLV